MFGIYAVQRNATVLKHYFNVFHITDCSLWKLKQLPAQKRDKEWIGVVLSQVRDVIFKRVFWKR